MEPTKKTGRIHPLMAGAAVAVMLVSLTGVAAMTGLLPNSHSTIPTAASSAAQSPATGVSAPKGANALVANSSAAPADGAAKPAPAKPRPAPADNSNNASNTYAAPRPAPATVAKAPAICESCGRVESVNAIKQEAQGSGLGIAAGAVLGGVLGNQVGDGNGRKLATVAGAVGGGFAGNEIEKRARSTTSYEVQVRMEDGRVRSFPYAEQPAWNVGDRVKVVNGQLASRA